MKKSSMKFSAAFSKFMFYFGNIVIGIIFVSPDLDDFRVSETGISDFCKYELPENILSGIGFF